MNTLAVIVVLCVIAATLTQLVRNLMLPMPIERHSTLCMVEAAFGTFAKLTALLWLIVGALPPL